MSDEFDKEAEREKLREKFERDEQKRQATRQMSELLLQGATMTNEHCERCGDPLFRDDGETFCPTCSGAQESPTQAGEQGQQQSAEQPQQPAEQQPPQVPGAESAPSEPERGSDTQTAARVDASRAEPTPDTGSPADDPRAELRRAVTRAARKANETTDPRTAKAWLEASREAAEALATLEQ